MNSPSSIDHMTGPQFLVLYLAVAAVTLLVCWWKQRQSDPTGSLPPLPIPSNPDAYEIAYLRGGENEVAQVVVFALIQRGYLRIREERGRLLGGQWIERAPEHPDASHLSPLERAVFGSFAGNYTAAEIFQDSALAAKVQEACAGLQERLQNEALLVTPEIQRDGSLILWVGAAIIVGLGGFKLFVALTTGHSNVMFLIMIGVVSLLALAGLASKRLTQRGRKYLQDLEIAFGQLKDTSYQPGNQLVLAMGLFGLGVLAGTPHDDFRKMFSKGESNGGASCGGGCGSGGDGGCGGGCGGCGGCG